MTDNPSGHGAGMLELAERAMAQIEADHERYAERARARREIERQGMDELLALARALSTPEKA